MSMTITKVAAVLALGVFSVVGAFACSSSDSNAAPAGASCYGGGGSSTNAACGTCVTTKCSTEYNACFSGSGACAAFASAGCKGLPDAACQTCVGKLSSCQTTNCATECKTTTGTDAGTDTAPTRPTPTDPQCQQLLNECCDSTALPAGAQSGCYTIAGGNDAANCKSVYDGFNGGGLCTKTP